MAGRVSRSAIATDDHELAGGGHENLVSGGGHEGCLGELFGHLLGRERVCPATMRSSTITYERKGRSAFVNRAPRLRSSPSRSTRPGSRCERGLPRNPNILSHL